MKIIVILNCVVMYIEIEHDNMLLLLLMVVLVVVEVMCLVSSLDIWLVV